jgi:hypothetical protein
VLTKEALLEITATYKPADVIERLRQLRLSLLTDQMKAVQDFLKELPPGELSTENTAKLDELISAVVTEEETQRIFALLKNEISKSKSVLPKSPDLLWKLWSDSYYFDRTHSLMAALEEILPSYISHETAVTSEEALAVIYLAFSVYGMRYTQYGFLFLSRLTHALGQSIGNVAGIDSQYKSSLNWGIGLLLQHGLDFTTGASGLLTASYIGGTLFEYLTHKLFIALNDTATVNQLSAQYPKTISFLGKVGDDLGFALGAAVGRQAMLPLPSPARIATPVPPTPYPTAKSRATPIPSMPPRLSPTAVPQPQNQCEPPLGSYQKTCDIRGEKYHSSDLKLPAMCQIDLSCKKLDDSITRHRLYTSSTMSQCLTRLENCDGQWRLRPDGQDKCGSSVELARKEGLTAQTDLIKRIPCALPTGSFLQTCEIKSQPYISTDSKLSQLPSFCEFTFDCKQLDGKNRRTTAFAQPLLGACVSFMENCDGDLVVRPGNERVCTDYASIRKEVGRSLSIEDPARPKF